nr:hypothetical protein [Tanacetum cinerariifolium]
ENIPAGASVPAAATIIRAGSSMDDDVHAAAAPSSSISTAADKGKAPMVDDSLPADLLSEQERVLAGVPATPSFPTDVSIHAATSFAPADISVPAISFAHAAVSVPAETMKRVTPIVDMADAAMIKFDSDSDDDPLPYVPYAGWEMVPSPLGSVHAYRDMKGHTKHFTTLRELLHMMEKTDLQKLLGVVDELYQTEEPDTFVLLLWGDLHVLFQSLDDEDALDF